MKILVTGDLVVSEIYDAEKSIELDLISKFKSSDFNIVNLEAPVTASDSTINKTGPSLKANEESTLQVLKSLNINLVTLANNHILDYDEKGVVETLSFCLDNNIATVGAGRNKEEASKIFYIDSKEGKIGIVNIAENEWASATESKAGANGMDLINDVKNIQLAKKECDFVFVIVHGGHEYYNLPSPRMQKQYRFYVDSGADIVVGHHTHCIIGMETYRGKPIYYSLGNFLFTKKSVYKEWYNGIVLQIELLKNKQISSKPIFIKQSIDSYKLSLIKNNELKEFKTKFNYNSLLIINEHKLFDSWNNFIMERYTQYKDYWSPLSFIKNKYLRYIFSKMGFMKISGKNGRMLFLNLLRCEAHSDLSKEVLQRELSKLDSNNNRKK